MKVLIVVDVQEDFTRGALANEDATSKIDAIVERIKDAREDREMVIFTQDTHDEDYLITLEGKKLPVKHCIYGTDGWELCEELKDMAPLRVYKPTFGSFDLIERIKVIASAMNSEPEIELVGFCTDICVLSNAIILRAAFPNSVITVNSKLCSGTTKENHDNALKAMECCQIDII